MTAAIRGPTASRLLQALRIACAAPTAPPPDAHLLVAVSGGPDSTALLAGLVAVAPEHRWRLTAAHVAHGLRAGESEAERERVRMLAARFGVGYAEHPAPVVAGPNLEARARRQRYQALGLLAASSGAARVALGHTADDQAETVLFRLLRGAGRGGLGAMRPVRGLFWRPLLEVRRADVDRFLADSGLSAAIDHSNADLRHARNRLRRLLLPLLEREWNPALVPSLVSLAARLRDEDEELEALAREHLKRLAGAKGLAASGLRVLRDGLARRVIRAWLEGNRVSCVTSVHVEGVLRLARGATGGVVAVPGPAHVLRAGEALILRTGTSTAAAAFAAAIAPGATVFHPSAGWRLSLGAPRPRRATDPSVPDARYAVFDAAAVPSPLRLRSPRPGDRIRIPGVGTRKVQDVLVDARVPRLDRPAVPVLEGGGAVIWIAGVARAGVAMVQAATREVVDAVVEPLVAHDVARLEGAW